MKLKQKVAVITGGNAGIGRVIALRFAQEGARVSICGRRRDLVDKVENEIREGGGEVIGFVTDVGKEEEVKSMVAQTVERFGTIDILVNNAAAEGPTAPIHEIEGKDWRTVVDTNLNGLFYCTKYVLPIMIAKRSGSILNIGSIAGVYAYPLRTPYNATKWASGGRHANHRRRGGSLQYSVQLSFPRSPRKVTGPITSSGKGQRRRARRSKR